MYHGSQDTHSILIELEIGADSGRYTYKVRLAPTDADSFVFIYEMLESFESGQANHEGILHVPGQRESHLRLSAENDHNQILAMILDHFKGYRVFHFHDTSETARIRLNGYIEANQGLYSDGGNLAAILYLYRQMKPVVYRRIVATVRHIMPMFDDFVLEPQRLNPRNILLNWKLKGNDYLFGPHQLSDGTLRAMALITQVCSRSARNASISMHG